MKYFVLLLSLWQFSTIVCDAQPVLSFEEFASGFQKPVAIRTAGDERLFVVEQKGIIWEVDENGQKAADPFLSIQGRVNNEGNEQGLLGLAFSPSFNNDSTFYVYYTGGTLSGFSVVARYKIDAATNKGDKNSEEGLITFDQPFTNHNAGDLHFGQDGYLYISTGDGGSGGDPQNNAQNTNSYLGKILRIDVNVVSSYIVPDDNPFVNDANVLNEIWALGLRNPWRFSFDKLNGDIWIADVGQGTFEEVNYLPNPLVGGVNFGWRCYEADKIFNSGNCEAKGNYNFPIFKYGRSEGFSVTGGFVYRGSEQKHFQGNYVVADHVFGNFWIISRKGEEWFTGKYTNHLRSVSSFGENNDGELFVAKLDNGKIYKLKAECTDTTIRDPQISFNVSNNILSVTSSDLKHENFQWYLNDNVISGANQSHYTATENGNYTLEVSYNKQGCIYRSETTLSNVIVGVDNSVFQKQLKISPNPSNGIFKLKSDFQIEDLEIYSADGQIIESIITVQNSKNADINLNSYASGLYFVKIKMQGETFYTKLMKH